MELMRKDIKRNFLREIIMRLDFQGVFQAELDNVIMHVKSILKEKQFNKFDEVYVNTACNNGNDMESITRQKAYVFISETKGYVIQLTTTVLLLTVNSTTYRAFEEYASIFIEIVNVYKENIDFFTVKRLGIRKNNKCLIQEVSEVTKYFNEKYYALNDTIDEYKHAYKELKEKYVGNDTNKTKMNLQYTIGIGSTDELKSVWQIEFDADVYMDQPEKIEEELYCKKNFKELNDILFTAYKNILTDAMKKVLIGRDAVPSGMLGVEDNE